MKKYILLIFLCFSVWGQAQDAYYYYLGQKVALHIDYSRISIVREASDRVIQLRSSSSQHKITDNGLDMSQAYLNSVYPSSRTGYSEKKLSNEEIIFDKKLSQTEYQRVIRQLKNETNVRLASPVYKSSIDDILRVTNNFYVKLFNASDFSKLEYLADKYRLEILGYNKLMPQWFVLSRTEHSNYETIDIANLFHDTGWFEFSEPEFLSNALALINDPYYSNQWALKNTGQEVSSINGTPGLDIKAEQAWAITTGDPNLKIAIYDEGIDVTHPDLKQNIRETYNVLEEAQPTYKGVIFGVHGTRCAGIAAAVQNNGIGISGVAPSCGLMAVATSFSNSETVVYVTGLQMAQGMSWAWRNGAAIISNSWRGGGSNLMKDAIQDALTKGRDGKGTVVVFAAGNGGGEGIGTPMNMNSDILVVGSTRNYGRRPGSADYGARLDVIAPTDVFTTDRQGTPGDTTSDYIPVFGGTSAACPHGAGVAALVLSVNPDLTARQVKNIIEKTTTKVTSGDFPYIYQTTEGRPNGTWNKEMGYGLINAYEAVKLAQVVANCVQDITISEVITASQDYQVANSIVASSTISDNLIVNFKANEIILLPGFRAKASGSGYFTASIAPCGGVLKSKPSSLDEDIDYKTLYQSFSAKLETSIEESKKSSAILNLYPNPTSGIIYITEVADQTISKVEVLNMGGKLVEVINGVTSSFDISAHPDGMYIIRVHSNDGVATHRIILRK